MSNIVNTADVTYVLQEDRGAVNGVASLNAQGKVPTSEIDLTVMATREYADYLQTQDLAALTIHTDKTLNVHGIPDTSLLATDGDVADALNSANNYTNTKHAAAQDLITSLSTSSQEYANTKKAEAITAAEAYADAIGTTATEYADTIGATAATFATGEVSAHNTSTSNVHGIADTLALATKTYADDAADAAEAAAEVTANIKVSDHNVDTTNVHGIADTSVLATATTVATAKSEAISAAAADATTKADAAKAAAEATAAAALSGAISTEVSGRNSAIATAKSEAIADAAAQINAVIAAAPAALNTLDELAAALGDDANFASTVTTNLAAKAPLASPTFTGTVTVAASGIAFTDGTQTKAGVPSVTTIGGAAGGTLPAGQQDKFLGVTDNAIITLPSEGYVTGQSIDFYQESGTGASFASVGGTVRGTPGLKFRTTNSVVTAMKISSGWLVFGDLSA